MAISPHDLRARQFTTVKRGGYDQREVEAFRTAAAEALEQATQEATAMEARARAAVVRLQELQQQAAAPSVLAEQTGPGADAPTAPDTVPAVAESETISRTLLLAQRTADATIAEAEHDAAARRQAAETEATDLIEGAKAESRRAGEAERVRVEGEVQALLARRDFLESDVDHLEEFLSAQRQRLTTVATELNDVTSRVGNGLGPMHRPQLSASDADHSGDVGVPGAEPVAAAAAIVDDAGEEAVEEADVAELIEQVGSSGSEDAGERPPGSDGRHRLFADDTP